MEVNYMLHRLPEQFIIVSDEEINDKDLVLEKYSDRTVKLTTCTPMSKLISEECSEGFQTKVIAQQDQIDFNGFEDICGWFDVEKLAYKFAKEESDNMNFRLIQGSYNQGFQKAQQLLSDRKFTEEDVYKAIELARKGFDEGGYTIDTEHPAEIIQSLRPNSWKIEGEFVNDKFKITKLC